MKIDEEFVPDRRIEVETDDEENEAQIHCNDDDDDNDDETGSDCELPTSAHKNSGFITATESENTCTINDTSWPQTYRSLPLCQF